MIVTLALRWLGFSRVSDWLAEAEPRAVDARDLARARRHAAAIDAVARRLPIEALCLARSLTLHWWLRGEGVPSELNIGVAKHREVLQAHAWVTLEGVPVNGTAAELEPFTPLVRAVAPTSATGLRPAASHAAPRPGWTHSATQTALEAGQCR